MDYKTAYAHDLLTQAEQCFTDKELSYSFLKFIAKNSKNRQEAELKLKKLRARICYLEDMAKNSYNEILDMQYTAEQEENEHIKEQRQVFRNDEIYDFFMDDKSDEFIKYLKEMAPLERINIAIRQFEALRIQSDKLIKDLKKNYQKMAITTPANLSKTSVQIKSSSTLQLDRGFYLNNTGRF